MGISATSRWARRFAVALVAPLLIAACGESKFEYVENGDEGLFFKLPNDWVQYDTREVVMATAPSYLERDRDLRRRWIVGFTASDTGGAGGIQQYDAQTPRGFAEIRYLDADERDDLDLKRLRTFDFIVDPDGNPIDPVQYMEDNPDGSIDIHQYGDVSLKRGGHGIALVASIDGENGTYVVTQIAAVDEATTRIYLFNIGCHYECYVQNQSLIDEIVDSWGLKEL